MPSFVPALLLLGAVGLAAGNIFLAIGGTSTVDDAFFVQTYSDDNVTYVAVELWWADAGDELRTPGWGPGDHKAVDPANATTWLTISSGGNITRLPFSDSRAAVDAGLVEVALLPGGCHRLLAEGTDPVPYWSATAGPPVTTRVPSADADQCPRMYLGTPLPDCCNRVDLAWVLRNETPLYPQYAHTLLQGIEGRSFDDAQLTVVDGTFLALEPWLRLGSIALAVAAGLALLVPSKRPALRPEGGTAGMAVGLVAVGERLLGDLRNAWITLSALVVLLGLPVAFSLSLFAGTLDPWTREPPFLDWQTHILVILLGELGLALLLSLRPALRAHVSLQRWRRAAQKPPVEGEL